MRGLDGLLGGGADRPQPALLQVDDLSRTAGIDLPEALAKGVAVCAEKLSQNGSVFWNEMTGSPLLDEHGRVTHFVGHHPRRGQRLRIDPSLPGIR